MSVRLKRRRGDGVAQKWWRERRGKKRSIEGKRIYWRVLRRPGIIGGLSLEEREGSEKRKVYDMIPLCNGKKSIENKLVEMS